MFKIIEIWKYKRQRKRTSTWKGNRDFTFNIDFCLFFPLSPTWLQPTLTTWATRWASYTYPSWTPGFTHGLFNSVRVAHLFSIFCCVFFFVFGLCLLCPMLPKYPDHPFLIVPYWFSLTFIESTKLRFGKLQMKCSVPEYKLSVKETYLYLLSYGHGTRRYIS